mmetsp:Transcript_2582/g.9883  ORF Transcript_2582/g.9883 Transcript_2582/m.9883 type:complete len:220 (+) Transcript_2582:1172-1831(+)
MAAQTYFFSPCGLVIPKMSMCSASQPWSRPILLAILSAKHFFPNKAFPPYPLPKDMILYSSGKWQMYLVLLQGHTPLSVSPCLSGFPTECKQGTKSSESAKRSSTGLPIRVMVLIPKVTYSESVSCTPILAIGDPRGPIENGITYMVLPFMHPSNNPLRVSFISFGSLHVPFGASSSFSEQIKVAFSRRATSPGSDLARYEFGRFFSFNLIRRPSSTCL